MMRIKTQSIDIRTPDGTCDSFIAYPDDGKSHPAVILFMDVYGPRTYLFEMTKKLAGLGYFVLLPNLFYRAQRAPLTQEKFPLTPESRSRVLPGLLKLLNELDHDDAMDDVGCFLDFLKTQPTVKKEPVGATGYCMGGGMALRAAATYPNEFAAVASFHGGNLVTDEPDSVHLLLSKIKARVYVAHADKDPAMNAEMIETFERALQSASLNAKTEVYRGALHGFTMLDLPAGNPEAVKKHWESLEAHLKKPESLGRLN